MIPCNFHSDAQTNLVENFPNDLSFAKNKCLFRNLELECLDGTSICTKNKSRLISKATRGLPRSLIIVKLSISEPILETNVSANGTVCVRATSGLWICKENEADEESRRNTRREKFENQEGDEED